MIQMEMNEYGFPKFYEKLDIENKKVIGRLKLDTEIKFLKKYKRIGGIDIRLLRQYLKYTKKDGGKVIGVYITQEGNLAPLHSKGWLLAPRIGEDDKSELELSTDKDKVVRKLK